MLEGVRRILEAVIHVLLLFVYFNVSESCRGSEWKVALLIDSDSYHITDDI